MYSNLDIPDLSDDAIRKSEAISQQITSELHDYYTNELKLRNYADRLIKITRLMEVVHVNGRFL